MGKLLVSGNGSNMYKNVVMNVITMIMLIGGGIFMLYLADDLSSVSRRQSDEEIMFKVVGIVFLVIGTTTIFPMLKNLFMAQTKINVYENEIQGTATTKIFTKQDFQLTYDKISNVDIIKKNAVILYTPYAKYTCYTSNCNEIRDTILKIKNR